MKDEKLIKVYNAGKKKFYINNLIAIQTIPIPLLLVNIMLEYINNNKWYGWDLVLYCLLAAYVTVLILYIIIVPIKWEDFKDKYKSIEKK
ncbi:hypothetical protein KHQ81_08690 [Mycoplasmatota bacterium]|nr:hypothetical protein KHQ81_08690 [Mycoplasmatota bacterium]